MDRRKKIIALYCAVLVFGMLGLSFAAVPLYEAFCRVTGYGGTPRIVAAPDQVVLERKVELRFDANVTQGLDWSFGPNEPIKKVRVGQMSETSYFAKNNSKETITARAIYNVVPEKAAYYFSKIECFCFQEQTLKPGERVNMPITFYIDSALDKDKDMRDVKTITLSYTFFLTKQEGIR